jgi:limonene-1,2-epoxide hydrolase
MTGKITIKELSQPLIDLLGKSNITVIDNLTSQGDTTNPLSANAGFILKSQLDDIASNEANLNLNSESFYPISALDTDIPLSDYNPQKHAILLFKNSTKVPNGDYSIVQVDDNYIIRLTSAVGNDFMNIFYEIVKLDISGLVNGIDIVRISANNVDDTTTRVLVSPQEKSQINANTQTIQNQQSTIAIIENNLSNITSTDEKVKINSQDTSGYLSDKLDSSTLVIKNNKVTVEGIDGVTVTKEEMNRLSGVTSNIQQQLNNLTGVSGFRGVFDDLASLENAPNPISGEYAVVKNATGSAYYFYDGTSWVFANNTEIPTTIDINNSTVGTLSKDRYEKQTASETTYTDVNGNLNSTTVSGALSELFTYADNGKKLLNKTYGSALSANYSFSELNSKIIEDKLALTTNLNNKGIVASNQESMRALIDKVPYISNVEVAVGLTKSSKINVVAPYTQSITLSAQLSPKDLCVSVIELVSGSQNLEQYTLDFDNADSSDFIQNDDITFDGVARIRNIHSISGTSYGEITEVKKYEFTINASDYSEISSFKVRSV